MLSYSFFVPSHVQQFVSMNFLCCHTVVRPLSSKITWCHWLLQLTPCMMCSGFCRNASPPKPPPTASWSVLRNQNTFVDLMPMPKFYVNEQSEKSLMQNPRTHVCDPMFMLHISSTDFMTCVANMLCQISVWAERRVFANLGWQLFGRFAFCTRTKTDLTCCVSFSCEPFPSAGHGAPETRVFVADAMGVRNQLTVITCSTVVLLSVFPKEEFLQKARFYASYSLPYRAKGNCLARVLC